MADIFDALLEKVAFAELQRETVLDSRQHLEVIEEFRSPRPMHNRISSTMTQSPVRLAAGKGT
jgi:hypothetical protein